MAHALSQDLSFQLIHTQTEHPEARAAQLRVFAAWRDLWAAAFAEVGASLQDTAFYSSSAVAAMFHGDQPIAIALLNRIDLLDDSNPWRAGIPEQTLHDLLAQGHRRVMMDNYLCVHADWRGSQAGFSAKLVLLSLLTQCLLDSDATALMGVMRRNRGMTRVSVDHGAQRAATSADPSAPLIVHGEPADVLTFPRELVPTLPEPLGSLVQRLWSQRPRYDLAASEPSASATLDIAS